MIKEIHKLSALELSLLYKKKSISPLEVSKIILDRINITHENLNAFCFCDEGNVLKQAKDSEYRWINNEQKSLFDGVPISIKDLIHVKSWPTLHGSKAVDINQKWDIDAPSVINLKKAGAIILGKTNTPEFGHKGVTENLVHGITNNPWNIDMNAGGSSGGAGSALASGLGPLALGTDGGGSCRKPANYCGVVGMKPSQGRVPSWPASYLWPLSSAGPMTRSVRDAAYLLDIISQNDVRDPETFHNKVNTFDGIEKQVQGLKVGFSLSFGGSEPRIEVSDIIENTKSLFQKIGVKLFDVCPEIINPMKTYRVILDSAWMHTASQFNDAQKEKFDPTFAAAVERGSKLTAVDLRKAFGERKNFMRIVSEFFSEYDLLILPTNPTTSYPHGTREPVPEENDNWKTTVCFTAPFNITGNPAISIPCGFSKSGLPVGLQIIGNYGCDNTVLNLARAFEKETGFVNQLAPDKFYLSEGRN